MRLKLFTVLALVMGWSGGTVGQAATEPAVVVLSNGQYVVTGKTYAAIVPPTGLLNTLTLKETVFILNAMTVNVEKELFGLASLHACSTITRPAPNRLVCEGEEALLEYDFEAEALTLSITAKKRDMKFFVKMNTNIERILSDSREAGCVIVSGGEAMSAWGVKEVRYFQEGQVLKVAGIDTLYGLPMSCLRVASKQTRTIRFSMAPATAEEKAIFAVPPVYAEALTLLSPMDWQVFQRRTEAEGVIRVAGKMKGGVDRIEFRRGDAAWQKIEHDTATGNFSGSFVSLAGGWYSCEVRAMKGDRVVAAKTIGHVGVGEVFVMAGQSNSTNSGEERQQPKTGQVSTFSGTAWRVAEDPQPGTHDGSGKGSPWPAFGDALAARLKVPIGLAVTGQGASRVEQWNPDIESGLFEWTLTRILQLGRQGFRMVLWHQGESDCATPAKEYADCMQVMIEQSQVRAGWSFPWMVARVGNTKGQDLLINRGVAFAGPYTDPLKGEYRGQGGKDVHFSAKGLQKHGELWAEKVCDVLERKVALAGLEAERKDPSAQNLDAGGAGLEARHGIVAVVKVDGQFFVTNATYQMIIQPTGLLGLLKVGKQVMIKTPLDLCTGMEFSGAGIRSRTRRLLCATITQPEPHVLVCEGSDATLRYTFAETGLTLSVTGKGEKGVRLFAEINELVDAMAWSSNTAKGYQLYHQDDECRAQAVKFHASGQVLAMEGSLVCYGAKLQSWSVSKGQTISTRWKMGAATDVEKKLFAFQSAYTNSMTVLSPSEYQVFQRQTVKEGWVWITGRMRVACDRVECRIGDGMWRALTFSAQTGCFGDEVTVAAGGWYRCELRAVKAGQVVARQAVGHFGVGEVFVTAGQSNAINSGSKRLQPACGKVSTFSGLGWRLADDPQPGAHGGGSGGSFYPPLGDALYARYKVPIAFAVTGHGGTSLAMWRPGGLLFNWMETRIRQLGPQGFRCVLWHQGEADGTTLEQEYYDRLKTLIEQSNLYAGWSFQWMVAQVGGWQTRKAKVRLWADGVALEGPDTDTLRGENRISATNCHFSEFGLRNHAALWADKLIALPD